MTSSLLPTSVTAVATRLRLVQQEMAERQPKERREQLMAEVRRATSQLPPQEVGAFLDQLEELFPPWGELNPELDPSAGPGLGVWNDPKAVVQQLSKLAAKGAQQRKEIGQLLQEQGLGPPAIPDKITNKLRHTLGADDANPVDNARVYELVVLLMESLVALDGLALNAFRQYAPDNQAVKARAIQETAGRYLTSEEDGVRNQQWSSLQQQIRDMSQQLRMMILAVRRLAQKHAETFAPAEIDAQNPGKMLKVRSQWNWSKYEQLCGGPDAQHLENTLLTLYGRVMEEFAKSAKTTPGGA